MTADFLKDQTAVLVLSIAVVMILEGFLTQRQQGTLTRRWISNFMLGTLNVVLAPTILGAILALYIATGLIESPGLLGRSPFDFTTSLIVTLVALELVGYGWHRVSHSVPFIWRMHRVHHSDPDIDVTTTLRHHPLEVALSNLVTLPVVLLLGPEPQVMMVVGAITALLDAISHGNLNLGALDRPISLLIVTPGFHCVHHSADLPYTDSNFSNNFPLCDYLFGTAKRWNAQEIKTRQFGLREFASQPCQRIDRLLIQPFLSKKSSAMILMFSLIHSSQ